RFSSSHFPYWERHAMFSVTSRLAAVAVFGLMVGQAPRAHGQHMMRFGFQQPMGFGAYGSPYMVGSPVGSPFGFRSPYMSAAPYSVSFYGPGAAYTYSPGYSTYTYASPYGGYNITRPSYGYGGGYGGYGGYNGASYSSPYSYGNSSYITSYY